MSVVSVDFQKSREAERQRETRAIIRKIKRDMLTKSERDVLMVLVNLWFYHKSGPDGVIYPGRQKVAKRANVTVVTVARSMARLRDLGVLHAKQYAKGGRRSTCYTVDVDRIAEVFNPSGVKVKEGQLVRFSSVQNDTVSDIGNDTLTPYQNDTRSKEANVAIGGAVALASGSDRCGDA